LKFCAKERCQPLTSRPPFVDPGRRRARGRYTVTVRSAVALSPGSYAYKHVATTNRRGQRFQMIRAVVVA
jgi:hypothetical protein